MAASQEDGAAVTVSLTGVFAGRDVSVTVNTTVRAETLRHNLSTRSALLPADLYTAVRDELFLHNRSQILEKVRSIWIEGLLESSLYHLARIDLGLESRPDAVEHHSDLVVQPSGTPISQIFDDSGNALLILGTPGTGKTTLLLELTRDLLDRAVQDERHLIPVVFNLSSWAEQRFALADWLIDELHKRYDVPRKLAKTWVDIKLIFPLLDGLDEVAIDHREACIETINTFLREHSRLPMVVCSRVADYEALTVRLRLPSAVIIQSLSRQQVKNYIDQAGASFAGLRTALQNDELLWELLTTPLMLSIAALTYCERSADEIHSSGTEEEHRAQLFAAYTDTMFRRPGKATPYPREQTERWLAWLAGAMKEHSQSIFYLEWMQPDWLPGQPQQRLVTSIISIIFGLLVGLLAGLLGAPHIGLGIGLLAGLDFGLRDPLIKRLSLVLVGGLFFGVLFWLPTGRFFGVLVGLVLGLLGGLGSDKLRDEYFKEIKPVEKLRWSWSTARHEWTKRLFEALLGGLLFGLSAGLLFGLLGMWSGDLHGGLFGRWSDTLFGELFGRWSGALFFGVRIGLFFGVLIGVLIGLLFGVCNGFVVGEIGVQLLPNEGIRRSLRNASKSGLLSGLFSGLLSGLLFGVLGGLRAGLKYGLFFGVLGGLGIWMQFGGFACLHHFVLRLVLWHKNFAPLNYIRFLDYATARGFLHKVGGGYIFVHRMLLEYFAAMYQTSAE